MKSSSYPVWVMASVPVLVLLHQGAWFWSDARLVLGLPLNLFYHSVLSLALSGLMLAVVRLAWPRYLDED